RTELAFGAELGAGPQVGERADGRARADHRVRSVRAHHGRSRADLDAAQRGVRADDRARADRGARLELHIGLDHHVLPQLDVRVQPRRRRVDDGHTRALPALHYAPVELGAERGQLDPVVDAL